MTHTGKQINYQCVRMSAKNGGGIATNFALDLSLSPIPTNVNVMSSPNVIPHPLRNPLLSTPSGRRPPGKRWTSVPGTLSEPPARGMQTRPRAVWEFTLTRLRFTRATSISPRITVTPLSYIGMHDRIGPKWP